jgi:hypothetical protein
MARLAGRSTSPQMESEALSVISADSTAGRAVG